MSNDLHVESLQNSVLNGIKSCVNKKREREGKTDAPYPFKYAGMDVKMSENKDKTEEYSEPIHWFAYKDQFSSTFIADKPFSNTILSVKNTENNYLKDYTAKCGPPFQLSSAIAGFHSGSVHYIDEEVE